MKTAQKQATERLKIKPQKNTSKITARRVARELAVIIMAQLPKDKAKLDEMNLDELVAKAVHMLRDYAKQALFEVNSFLVQKQEEVHELERDHVDNAGRTDSLEPVAVTTGHLKEQFDQMERAINLVAEALDIPDLVLSFGHSVVAMQCPHCKTSTDVTLARPSKSDVYSFMHALISTYLEHRHDIDAFIRTANAKWPIERMVTIDRNILRLACTEALYMQDVPINVCISEAVELCHHFADDRAAKFINGILSDLSKDASYFRRHGRIPELMPENDNIETEEIAIADS